MAGQVVDELITLLGLETDPAAEGEAKNFTNMTKSIMTGALLAGAAIASILVGASALTAKFAETADAGGKFADSIGVNFEAMQELEYGVQRAGGTIEDLRGDLLNLTKTLSSPIPGEFNQMLAMMGISSRTASGQIKTADQVIGDLAKKFDGLSSVKAQQLGAKIGLSQSTVKLLQQGADGIAELRAQAQKLGGIIPASAAKDAAEYRDVMLDIATMVKGVSNTVGAALLPVLTAANTKLRDWLMTNREWIASGIERFVKSVIDGFQDFIDILRTGYKVVTDFLSPLNELLGGFDALDLVAPKVTAVLLAIAAAMAVLAVNTLIAAAPFIAIAAAVGLVLVTLEDLYTYIEGGDSLIGRFFAAFEERFPGMADNIKSLIAFWGGVADAIMWVINAVWEYWKVLGQGVDLGIDAYIEVRDTIAQWAEYLDPFINRLSGIADALKPALDIINKITDFFTTPTPVLIGRLIRSEDEGGENKPSLLSRVVSGFSGDRKSESGGQPRQSVAPQAVKDSMPMLSNLIKVMPTVQARASVTPKANIPASIVNTTTQNSTSNQGDRSVFVQVNGAGDPAAVGFDVAGRVSKSLGTTVQTITPGARAPVVF